MSPLAQFFSVATITAAIVWSPLAAGLLLAATGALTVAPFIIAGVR